MFKGLFKNYIYPVAVFAGGMVGVGFLSLPYIASKTGIWVMLLYFVVLTALILIINRIFCEISLKTPDFTRFPGFVGYYLGKWPKVIAMILTSIGSIGVLLVYILVGGQFLFSALFPIFSGDILIYVLLYFALASIIVYFDIKVVAKAEFWIMILLVLSLFFIFAEGLSKINLMNLFTSYKLQASSLFLPYGPILFALWGAGLIPEIEEMLRASGNQPKKILKKIVKISTILVSVFYLLFTLLILSIAGNNTDQTALTSLKNFLGNGAVSVSLLIGALATFTAFITQGIILKKTIMFDLKVKHWQAFVITCFTPMILYLIGVTSFLTIISFVGGIVLGINGILILLIYKKIKGKKMIIYPLSVVFLLGIIYELIYFIK
jgi:amino acid permease